ncbi:MAG: DUF6220 domain-containing protein [Actinomycetota bacterium]|nr:DUF6220 domain-containing protein [Actinomycetota bacterium]
MRSAFKWVAILIAAEVVIQAAAIGYAVFGEGKYIRDGHSVTKQNIENVSFSGVGGFVLHGINGTMVIPLLSLILIVLAFVVKLPGGVRAAAVILGMVVVQVILGKAAVKVPILGALHGLLALGIFAEAVRLAISVPKESPVVENRVG